jgi:hypothetical protein
MTMIERPSQYPELFYDCRRAALAVGALAEKDLDAAKRLAREVRKLVGREVQRVDGVDPARARSGRRGAA